MNINELETPALILDKNIFESNMARMAELLKGSNMKLRPHYKSNKCPEIAKIQIKNGASGITCAKLGEAEDLAEAGISNILIGNQVVQPSKVKRVGELAKKCYLIICVDNADNVRALSEAAVNAGSTIHCLVEYEVGMKDAVWTPMRNFLSSPSLSTPPRDLYLREYRPMRDIWRMSVLWKNVSPRPSVSKRTSGNLKNFLRTTVLR